MKTIIRAFILVMVMVSLNSCDPPEYLFGTEGVIIEINNSTSQTLNLYYTDEYYLSHWADVSFMPYWSDTLHCLPFSTNHFFGMRYRDKNIRNNVFEKVIKNDLIGKQIIVIEEMSGDTLAKWNDSSAVFTEQQYWTIQTEKCPPHHYPEVKFYCTLTLTDEVLKLK